jgi:lipoprotein-anchoring transpeptidase ErfK/SrfK
MSRPLQSWFSVAACLVAGSLLSSCGVMRPPGPPPRADYVLYQWRDDGIGGPVRITINLGQQRLTAFRGDREIGWCVVATGLEGHRTPAGSFRITEKVVDKYSTIYGVIKNPEGITINSDARVGRDRVPPGCEFVHAPMPYWQRLTNYGIGMHAGPIPQPGLPASHGCIRMPEQFAPLLFDVTVLGTPVKITQ